MAKVIPQLSIKYDDRRRCLVLTATNSMKTRGQPFSVEWPIDELKRHLDSGETAIGAAVLAFFDQVVDHGLGLKNYQAQAISDEQKILGDLQQSAKAKDPSAQFMLAMFLLRRGAKDKSVKDVSEAEKWLEKAHQAGNKEASAYLQTSWPSAKTAILERIRSR